MNFWGQMFSGDNSHVNFMFVLGLIIATPFALIAIAALIWHIWIVQKPMDSETVKLLSIGLGLATGGAGVSMFSRTTWSQTMLQAGGQVFKKGPRPKGGES